MDSSRGMHKNQFFTKTEDLMGALNVRNIGKRNYGNI